MNTKIFDVIVIGGGQAGLAAGYHLRKTGLDYLILDGNRHAGGAWQRAWESLILFSPAAYSSLPGWQMPATEGYYPTRYEIIDYLSKYEARYNLPVKRPVEVKKVTKDGEVFVLQTGEGKYYSRTVISATGTWHKPYIPEYPGRTEFTGLQIHSAHYRNSDPFKGMKVLVVGEGNSGAQILAEVSKVADTTWVTQKKPKFLDKSINGLELFLHATNEYFARKRGEKYVTPAEMLGDIVMVPNVQEAFTRNVYQPHQPFKRFYQHGVIWDNGNKSPFDAVIWCTGFGYALDHLEPLDVIDQDGRIKTDGVRSSKEPGLWLVGYGNWTGFASATLIGVGRYAKRSVLEIVDYLGVEVNS